MTPSPAAEDATTQDAATKGPTFEVAIAQTQQILAQPLAAADLKAAIANLVQTPNGARGFFVTYLTTPDPVADHPSEAVLEALATAPDLVASLLVKNLAMSTAMAIAHRRPSEYPEDEREAQAQGSEQVQRRTFQLCTQLALARIQEEATDLHQSTQTGDGDYGNFLSRWRYDDEQRQAIGQITSTLLARLGTNS